MTERYERGKRFRVLRRSSLFWNRDSGCMLRPGDVITCAGVEYDMTVTGIPTFSHVNGVPLPDGAHGQFSDALWGSPMKGFIEDLPDVN